MASFSIDIANNGSNVFTPTARRAGTPASGGTVLTLPWVENNNGGANTTSKLAQAAFWAAFTAVVNDFSTNTAFTAYQITVADDGNGVFTPTARKNGTPSSGGTLLTIPWVTNNNGGANTTTNLLKSALWAAFTAAINDRSTNG